MLLTAGFLTKPPAAAECTPAVAGNSPSDRNTSSGAIHSGIGQTFVAGETLLVSLTVWRVAEQTPDWQIGMHLYIFATDSVGSPAVDLQIAEGRTLIIPAGDGVNPIEFKWIFDPPLALPSRGKYAFFLFQDPCAAYFDVIANQSAGGSTYSGGELWYTFRSLGCTPIPGMNSIPDADLIFRIEFCGDKKTPVRTPSWGRVKLLYR